jgi:hypothetical protein
MSQRNVTRWLIHHAARHAPDSVAERLEEEWLADLEARPSGVVASALHHRLLLGDPGDRFRASAGKGCGKQFCRSGPGSHRLRG